MHPDPRRRAALQHVRTLLAECIVHLMHRDDAGMLETIGVWDSPVAAGLPPELFETTARHFRSLRRHLLNRDWHRVEAELYQLVRLYEPTSDGE